VMRMMRCNINDVLDLLRLMLICAISRRVDLIAMSAKNVSSMRHHHIYVELLLATKCNVRTKSEYENAT
jgi:hypothetical protein